MKNILLSYSNNNNFSGLKMELSNFNKRWLKYEHVWTTDRDEFLYDFVHAKPDIYDFENELKKYNLIEAELVSETDDFRYGRMLVTTTAFKASGA